MISSNMSRRHFYADYNNNVNNNINNKKSILLEQFSTFDAQSSVYLTRVYDNGEKIIEEHNPEISFMVRVHENLLVIGTIEDNIRALLDIAIVSNVKHIAVEQITDIRTFEYNSEGNCVHVKFVFETFQTYRSAMTGLSAHVCTNGLTLNDYICQNHSKYKYGQKYIHNCDYDFYSSDVQLLVMTWDIEVLMYSNTGNFVNANSANDIITLIAGTIHMHDSDDAKLYYAFTCMPIDKDRLAVLLKDNLKDSDVDSKLYLRTFDSESSLLSAYIAFVSDVNPDIMTGFNDSSFDWSYFRTRYMFCNGIDPKILNAVEQSSKPALSKAYSREHPTFRPHDINPFVAFHRAFNGKNIKNITSISFNGDDMLYNNYTAKIDATVSQDCITPKSDKTIFIDVRNVYRQAFPAEHKSSLNHFLSMMGLESKLDIDIHVLMDAWRAYYTGIRTKGGAEIYANKYITSAIESAIKANEERLGVIYDGVERTRYATSIHSYVYDRLKNKYNTANNPVTSQDLETMTVGACYCIIDSFRCHQLLRRKDIIDEKIKMAEICRITLNDSVLRAGSYKITHLMQEFGKQQYSFKINMNADAHTNILLAKGLKEYAEVDRYKGAHVQDPNVGLHYKVPIVGLDFSSLYPSIIRTFNISNDMFQDELLTCKTSNIASLPVVDDYNELVVNTEEFIANKFLVKSTNLDNNYDMNSFTLDNDFNINTPVVARFYTHRKGLIPIILERLGSIRSEAKKILLTNKSKCEQLESTQQIIPKELLRSTRDANQKQLAVKLLMNSIYGVMGSKVAGQFVYNRFNAEIITKTGRMLLKSVINYINNIGLYDVHYGDTDSCYISMKPSHHEIVTIEAEYQNGDTIETMANKKIDATRNTIKLLQKEVNGFLSRVTGDTVLSMAYEEVLYPTVFIAKKTYYGIKHEEHNVPIKITDTSLFARGGSLVRRSTSSIAIFAIKDILFNRLFSYNMLKEFMTRQDEKNIMITLTHEALVDSVNDVYNHMSNMPLYEFMLTKKYRFTGKTETFITKYVNNSITTHIEEARVFKIDNPELTNFNPIAVKPNVGESVSYVRIVSNNTAVAESIKEISLIRPGVDLVDFNSYFKDIITDFQPFLLGTMTQLESSKYLVNYFKMLLNKVADHQHLRKTSPSNIIQNSSVLDTSTGENTIIRSILFRPFEVYMEKYCTKYRWVIINQIKLFQYTARTNVLTILFDINAFVKRMLTKEKGNMGITTVRTHEPVGQYTALDNNLYNPLTNAYVFAIKHIQYFYLNIKNKSNKQLFLKYTIDKRNNNRLNLIRLLNIYLSGNLSKFYNYNEIFDKYITTYNIDIPHTISKGSEELINTDLEDTIRNTNRLPSIDITLVDLINKIDTCLKLYIIYEFIVRTHTTIFKELI